IFVYNITSFAKLIYLSAIIGFSSVILLTAVRYQTPQAVLNTRKEELKFSYVDSLVEKSSWFPAFITIIINLGYGSVVTFIVIFGEERGIEQIFLFYIFNALMATLGRPIAGRWFDEKGPIGLVLFCTFATFVGMWVLSFAHSSLLIAISGALFGLGFGCLIPTLQSWALVMTPSHRRGVANGMIFSSIDLGIGLSGLIFGVLAQFVGTASIFRCASLFLVAAIVLVVIMEKKKRASISRDAVSKKKVRTSF
ncbi:MAG: MFS transporter, partial [Bacillus sp. (in: firmicutes)]